MARKVIDCRDIPSESECTLTIAGEEDEVLRAGVMHAVDAHGEKDSPELREMLRRSIKDESGARGGAAAEEREQAAPH